jgi:hypothetical protein
VATEQAAPPIFQPVDAVVVGEFGRATNEQAVAHFLLIFILRPAVAILAERHFVPLAGFVVNSALWRMPRRAISPGMAHAIKPGALMLTGGGRGPTNRWLEPPVWRKYEGVR